MEDYLQSIKHIADSLASIRTCIPDIDLVQLTLNSLDEDYHTLVTTPSSYGTNLITFDDLRSKLIQKFLKTKELFGVQHLALATLVTSSESSKVLQSSSFD